MRNIKSFRVFESGLPYSHVQDIQLAIRSFLSEERFQPHINQVNRWTGEMRKFYVGVVGNESKFGVQYDVVFRLDEPVDIKLVNSEIKNCWRDIMEIIMDRSKSNGQVKLTKFDYFGHSATGRKNGHTMEIEDVSDELDHAIELAEVDSAPVPDCPIMFQFTLVN